MMLATKKIHLNPNGNIIKVGGNIYRHYTRNITVSLPSIFYAISHGATVYEVLNDGTIIELTPQNYALDNNKIAREQRIQEEIIKRKSLEEDNQKIQEDENIEDDSNVDLKKNKKGYKRKNNDD